MAPNVNLLSIVITCGLAALLVLISFIDVRRFIIPNWLNLCLFLLGCVAQLVLAPISFVSASTGAAALLCLFSGVRYLHYKTTGRLGLGLGDVKMAGAAGIWIGAGAIPAFLMIASLMALIAFGLLQLAGRVNTSSRLPFGPFLAVSLLVCWLSPELWEMNWRVYS